MADLAFETPYGINVTGVSIAQWPRTTTVTFDHGGVVYELRLTDPRPFNSATEALVECYQIRIMDHKTQSQQEFGRYQIEIHGEDGCYARFTADAYDHVPISTATTK
ncbi:MAG: hypothetical protein NXI04_23430 [Planctomycetaceae bacterium]|nr:hypothetical protein [Planctomycetaceae bacterium]